VIQNILQDLGLGGMGSLDWVDVTVSGDSWMALVKEVMNRGMGNVGWTDVTVSEDSWLALVN